uniref:Ribosome assembly factor mrt4 n=1 Tax=Hirondellea gigas TaxID=1518452 RepID=A0A6A7G8K6_9CRUS
MPKSKRERIVALSRATKRTKQQKGEIIQSIRDCVDMHTSCYVISFSNRRNVSFQPVRDHWRSSRFFCGKNKLMQIALGRSKENEHRENLQLISENLVHDNVLFVTSCGAEEVLKYFEELSTPDFARTGSAATEDFDLKEGVLEGMEFSMEPRLKALSLPVRLNNRKIELLGNISVCKVGQTLTAEQSSILKLFNRKTSVFSGKVLCYWENGKFTDLSTKNGVHPLDCTE